MRDSGAVSTGARVLVISAAEPSGDLLCEVVLTTLRGAHVDPGRRPHIRAVAGPRMRAAWPGLEVIARTERLGGAGIVELLPRLPAILQARRALTLQVDASPGLALAVDAPDLHLPWLDAARSRGIKTAMLVCPQLWAWRPDRLDLLRRAADRVLCLWPFEVPWLRARGLSAVAVGHPAIDRPVPLRRPRERPILALLPGSRPERARRLLTPMLRAAAAFPDHDAVLSWVHGRPPSLPAGVRVDAGPGWDLLAQADLAAVGAGTASFEAGILGVPTAVIGALHPWTWALVRRRIEVSAASMPNLLLRRSVQPEVVQDDGPGLGRALMDARGIDATGAAAELRALVGGDFGPRCLSALGLWP